MCVLSHVQLFVTSWTVAGQAPLFMGFSRQECWSALPRPSPGDLPAPGIEPGLLHLLHWEAGSLLLALPGKPNIPPPKETECHLIDLDVEEAPLNSLLS